MDIDDCYSIIMERDQKILALESKICDLSLDNNKMKSIMDMYVKKKYKRGEQTAFSINIDLFECIQGNLNNLKNSDQISTYMYSEDSLIEFILVLLVGEKKTDIPLCIVDSNLIAYKDGDIKFMGIVDLCEYLSSIIVPTIKAHLHDMTDVTTDEKELMNVLQNKYSMKKLNNITNIDLFETLVRKCLKHYNFR
jgi:hypothetical protein